MCLSLCLVAAGVSQLSVGVSSTDIPKKKLQLHTNNPKIPYARDTAELDRTDTEYLSHGIIPPVITCIITVRFVKKPVPAVIEKLRVLAATSINATKSRNVNWRSNVFQEVWRQIPGVKVDNRNL